MSRSTHPESRYRYGERSPITRAEHTLNSREYGRALADVAFTAEDRGRLVSMLARRISLPRAAEILGVTTMAVYGRMRWDAEFAQAVEDVFSRLCRDNPRCGQWDGHRNGGRCKRCRTAKRSKATG